MSHSMLSLLSFCFFVASASLLLCYASLAAEAKLSFPAAISSNMVLQRGNAVIWGKSDIAFGIIFVNGSAVQANEAGEFSYRFEVDPYAALDLSVGLPDNFTITPFNITIKDADSTVELTNLLFGDVFLCSGQSNMAMNLYGSYNSSIEIADSSNYPNLRLFSANYYSQWKVSGPSDFNDTDDFAAFSATCYFTGRNLHRQLGIPIGLVAAAVSGTAIEYWSSPEAMAKCPYTTIECPIADVGTWWSKYIVPLLQMRFRGIVWYQGESNEMDPVGYQCRFPALIEDWRKNFQAPEIPFTFVQLAAYTDETFTFPEQRIAQAMALQLPKTGMATAIDLGDPLSPNSPIHPRNKQTIGYRMAKVILKLIYGWSIVAAGPEPVATNCTRLFINSSSPLVARGTEECSLCCSQSPFQVLDSTWEGWRRVDYRIEGSSIVFDECLDHMFIRYAMDNYPQCAIYNDEGFPMAPFVRMNPLSVATAIDLFAPFLCLPPVVLILCVVVSIDAMAEKGMRIRIRALDFSSPFLFEVCAFALHAARVFVFDRRFEALVYIAVTSHAMHGTKYASRRYAWVVFSVIFTALTSVAGNGFRSITFGTEQSDYLTYVTIAPQALLFLYLLVTERRGFLSFLAVAVSVGLIVCAVTQPFTRCIFEGAVYTVAIVACHQNPSSLIVPDQTRSDDELSISNMENGYVKANSPSQSPTEIDSLKLTDSMSMSNAGI